MLLQILGRIRLIHYSTASYLPTRQPPLTNMEVLYSGALDGLMKEMFDGITAIWDGPAIVLVSDLDGSTRVICGAFFGGGVDGDEDAMRRGCVFQLSPIHRVFRCGVIR